MLIVNEHQLRKVLGNLRLLGSDARWIAKSETIPARQRMTSTLLAFLNDALNRVLDVLLEIVTSHNARSGLTSQITDPAPPTLNMQLKRHRRVRCICFVGRGDLVALAMAPQNPPGTSSPAEQHHSQPR